ncbi:MAG: glycosyltransferase [Lachnospiraceae bacterium]|nr:glycosyltransferase [Lachnospiraceae bacterium]
MSEITIVIPNYNGIKYLEDCLNSIMMQTDDAPEFEVLIVDNGSTDGSRELLVKLEQETALSGRVNKGRNLIRNILLEENTGFCHAVNVGIEASQSPYVLLLNNDTKIKTGFIKNLYNAIQTNDRIFSVSSKMLMWDKPELLDDAGDYYNALGWAFARGKGKLAAKYNQRANIFSACGGASIYRKAVFEEIGLFDEAHFAYLEDLDIGYRARIAGYRNIYEPGAEVLHYGSASTGSRYNEWKTERAAANSIYVISKNMPILQILLNLPLLFAGFLIKWLFFCKKKMGKLYLKGLKNGFVRCFSAEGREKKVRFRCENFKNYVIIQIELWINLIRRFA